jgi:glycosyltransferase involved in cell wall biosynthesis
MALRLLTFSTLFPDSARPNHGVFVENRLRHLVASGEATSVVLSPTPWFPFADPRFGGYARFAAVPRFERRNGLDVHHPRYLVIPKFGMSLAPWLLHAAARPALARLLATGHRFDAIDAHYIYPDGVAATWLADAFRLPVVLTARGSDVTELPDYAIPRALIRRALRRADALIGVSRALCDRMIELGADPAKTTTLRNGVDTAIFRPADRAAARSRLGLTRNTLISVGNLVERKRNHLTLQALSLLPDWDFVIVGDGPERPRLETMAVQLGVADRVRFLGAQPHARLPEFYTAADAMVLASSREGWANVLLESMACGTAVIASNIPGNPEVVQRPEAGLILRENTPEAIAEAVRALFAAPPDREATRRYAQPFSWDATTEGQLEIFRRVARTGGRAGVASSQ